MRLVAVALCLAGQLVAPASGLDAGTVMAGLRVALERDDLDGEGTGTHRPGGADLPRASRFFRSRVRAILLSHAHLDHIGGLVIQSPDEGKKPLYGLPGTIDALRDLVSRRPTR